MKEADRILIENVLATATKQIAGQRGVAFTRSIKVTPEVKDISVQKDLVRVHPEYATEGNPVHLCIHILELCSDFDTRAGRWRRQHIAELQTAISRDIRKLAALSDEATVRRTISDALEE